MRAEDRDRHQETVGSILELAAPLARATTVDGVAAALARSAITMLDAAAVAVLVGPSPEGPRAGLRSVTAVEEIGIAAATEVLDGIIGTPWGADLCVERRAVWFTPDELDDEGAALLSRLGASHLGVYPLVAPDRLLGSVLVAWSGDASPEDPEVALRARAIRDFGTMALRSAQLLGQLRHQALHDGLTGLANRQLFADRVDRAVASARRRGRQLAVVLVDLDGFKGINDTLGHDTGDEVLAVLAGRLVQTLREEDTLARLGGDEFAVLLPELDDAELAMGVAEKVRAAIAAPIDVEGHRLRVTPSVGVVVYPQDGRRRDELMRHADLAMYRAKALGRDGIVRFHRGLLQAIEQRSSFEEELRVAIAEGQLDVAYQPQVDLQGGRISGMEALVRWEHPVRGRLGPDEFIGVAEDSGLIVALDTWVLARACRDLRAWRSEGLPVPRLGINVATANLRDPAFVDALREILTRTGLPAGTVELEVADGLPLDEDGPGRAALERLRGWGVHLAVDDFGSRRSELGQLRAAPVDAVKIDRRFIAEIDRDGLDAPRDPLVAEGPLLVDGIVALAGALGLRTVAIGVETEAQRAYLAHIGCDAVQGWLFAEPIDSGLVGRLLRHAQVQPAEVGRAAG